MKYRPHAMFLSSLVAVAACSSTEVAPVVVPVGDVPPGCDTLFVDTDAGTLNGVAPTVSQAEVRAQFPCATGDSEDGEVWNCGGGVFFRDHAFYAYTGRNYWEFRAGFKGVSDIVLLGLSEADLLANLGQPERSEGTSERRYHLFRRAFGTLSVRLDDGVVTVFALHRVAPNLVELCI